MGSFLTRLFPALATLFLWDSGEDLFGVLAAAGIGRFSALGTCHSSAHADESPRQEKGFSVTLRA
jgi:hypothetical protein